MADNGWFDFTQTGSIFDYLKYRENQNGKEKVTADDRLDKGISNQRTDDRGE